MEINKDYTIVPVSWANNQDGALVGDILSMKHWGKCDLWIQVGDTIGQAAAVTVETGTSVSSAATSCSFTRYLSTGFILYYDGASVDTPAAAGETVTGNGGGIGYVYQDLGDRVICYAHNGTTYVDDEVLTFSGGKTAVANGIQVSEDIMIPRTATSDTFNIAAVAYKQYVIPITADMLGDGYDCVELNIADANATDLAAWAVLSKPRYTAEIAPSAIYD